MSGYISKLEHQRRASLELVPTILLINWLFAMIINHIL